MAKSKIVKVVNNIAENVTEGYQKIEDGVVGAFTKITDKFVDNYLTRDGESVAEAKARLAQEQADREASARAEAEKRAADQAAMVAASMQASVNAGKQI